MTEAASSPRRPGRPRSAQADQAILGAALALVSEVGLRALTIEAVAARAGVGKATIYRRWTAKEDLVVDALRSIAVDLPTPQDTGSFRGDWMAVIAPELEQLLPRAAPILARLMAEAAQDPDLLALVYDKFIAPRRGIAAELLRRGIARGELRADLDPELTIDLLVGPLMYRGLITGGDPAALVGMAQDVLDAVLPGLTTT